jgi:hypothetical protein
MATGVAHPNAGTNFITVLDGSTVIWRKRLSSPKIKAFKPGKTLHLSVLWNGKPNQAGLKKIEPGIDTIEVQEDGYSVSDTIRIE